MHKHFLLTSACHQHQHSTTGPHQRSTPRLDSLALSKPTPTTPRFICSAILALMFYKFPPCWRCSRVFCNGWQCFRNFGANVLYVSAIWALFTCFLQLLAMFPPFWRQCFICFDYVWCVFLSFGSAMLVLFSLFWRCLHVFCHFGVVHTQDVVCRCFIRSAILA